MVYTIPTSDLEVSGPLPGQLVFPDDSELVTRGVKAGQNIKVGDYVTFDSNGFMTHATNTTNRLDGLGVCTIGYDNTSGADGDGSAQCALPDTYIYVVAGGAIKNFVQIGLSTLSNYNPQQLTSPADATTAPTASQLNAVKNFFGRIFARYFYHQKEENAPTSAVSGDIIAVRLGAD